MARRPAWFVIAVVLVSAATAVVVARSSGAASRPAGQWGAPGTITTIAGGVGGPGPAASAGVLPCAVTYAGGSLYVTDLTGDAVFSTSPSVVRRISAATGRLSTLAGNGTDPDTGSAETTRVPEVPDGSPARSAAIATSCGVAVDHQGNVLVSDSTSYQDADRQAGPYGIRVIAMSTGVFYGRPMTRDDIYTLVSAQSRPFTPDFAPGAIAVDAAGNVLFTSADNHVYALAERSGTFYGVPMTAGRIYVVAGGGGALGDGGPAVRASLAIVSNEHYSGNLDAGLRIDHNGNLLIADQSHCRVRVVADRSGTFYGRVMRAGDIGTIAGNGECRPYASAAGAGDGGLATSAEVNPAGIAVDRAGNVVIADGNLIRVVAESAGLFYGQAMQPGHVYRIAGSDAFQDTGNGGPAVRAGLAAPSAVSVDGAGNVVIGSGMLRVVAARSGVYYGRRMRAGHIYAISAPRLLSSGDGDPATRAEMAVVPASLGGDPLAVDRSGDLLVADDLGREVRIIPAASGELFGRRLRVGDIYRIAGNGRNGPPGDGGRAAGAGFGRYGTGIEGIAADRSGNLLIADGLHGRVRVVAVRDGTFYGQPMTAGRIYTVAGGGPDAGNGVPATDALLGLPAGAVTDGHGNLVIASDSPSGCRVRVAATAAGTFYGQPMTARHIYTIAGNRTCAASGDGGPARSAGLASPLSVVVSHGGDIVVPTSSGIRVIAAQSGTQYGQQMTAGDIYTVALPTPHPAGLAADQSGNLIVTDPAAGSVVVIADTTGTFYGQPMTAGHSYRIAGDGLVGHTGDGGRATSAALLEPTGIAVTAAGELVLAQYHWISEIGADRERGEHNLG